MKENIKTLFGGRGQIIPLSEGSFTIDKTKLFVPFDENKDDLQTRTSGSLLVEVQPFVIVTPEDVLLLDTGLGFANEDGTLQIHQNLLNAGIDPRHVTKILLTHLHKDHAGGVCLQDHTKLSFPDATYFLQQRELQFAFEKGFPSFIPEELEVLRNSSQIKLLTDDAGTIGDSIHYQVTAAHSPFHQVFWIKKEDQIIFFGGDDAPQLQQMKHRFVAKYDYDGKKAAQLRQQWWQKRLEEKWIFLFYHDIKTPMYSSEDY
jgi:glyoxylase-like metal-dependent hydrolase (beta-lactamase superfamily II)